LDTKEIQKIKDQINDLKNRLPAHSVKPAMLQELERLEEKLSELQKS
jgi:hypothetical protein